MIPVASAVARITNKILDDPYFSSNSGPTISSIMIFPIKCSQPACPTTCPNRRTYVSGDSIEERYTLNSAFVVHPFVIHPSASDKKQTAVKQMTTGELNENLIRPLFFMFYSYPQAPLPALYITIT